MCEFSNFRQTDESNNSALSIRILNYAKLNFSAFKEFSTFSPGNFGESSDFDVLTRVISGFSMEFRNASQDIYNVLRAAFS